MANAERCCHGVRERTEESNRGTAARGSVAVPQRMNHKVDACFTMLRAMLSPHCAALADALACFRGRSRPLCLNMNCMNNRCMLVRALCLAVRTDAS